MKDNIVNGKLNIITSGNFLTFDYDSDIVIDTEINIEDNSIPLRISFAFVSNDEDDKPSATRAFNDGELQIQCINFKGGLGMGVVDPIEIQMTNGKRLYFRYWVSDRGGAQTMREIKYTLYMEN